MYKNFIRVASANIKTKLLNVKNNKEQIIKYMEFTGNNNIDIMIFPELTLTGLSAGEMISSSEIIEQCEKALVEIIEKSKQYNNIIVIGSPLITYRGVADAMLYIKNGEIINAIYKNVYINDEVKYFDNINEDTFFYFNDEPYLITNSQELITPNNINIQTVFENEFINGDTNINKSANIVLIAGNINSDMNSMTYTRELLKAKSKINRVAIVYAGASNYESSSNYVYSSSKYIIENGKILSEGKKFNNGIIYTEINIDELKKPKFNAKSIINTNFDEKEFSLKRKLDKYPYFPSSNAYEQSMKNILEIQSEALVRRLRQLNEKKVFIGISGGLDSTLGLIVSSLAFHKLGIDSKNIVAVTMPGLGTSNRTKNNAINLAKLYNVSLKEISIKDSVLQHFEDIGHDENQFDTTYENAQARERTQVLMDLSNKFGGLVLGTGNMSEIALGWATYNGDHMSMYGVNSGLPKTLLREVVRYVANLSDNEEIKTTLQDIIDTPISPELLPTSEDGNISQKTEENIGPYELHDFYIYHFVRNKSKIDYVLFMAKQAFSDKYSESEIEKYLKKFLWRFTTQQFKRNVSVDSPQILDYSLNPKYGFIMPSDIDTKAFIKEEK